MKRPFVDRIEELRHLNKSLKYDNKENPVLVFTGIGGMGKTALRIAFENEMLKSNMIPYAVLDYDGDPNLRSIEATLRTIRRQLGRHKVKTPVFDFLYGRYFELSMGVKLSAKNYPPELEAVATILDGIPMVGNVSQIIYGLSQLGLRVKERVQRKEWLYRIRDLEPREVLNLLPEVLAEDLEEAILSHTLEDLKASGCRIVLLLDAYELISESQLDDTLHRKLLLLTPHLLRVIFTRTPLPWEHKFPQEWRGKITHFPALDDLSQEDAMIFLRKKDITSADLQEHLYQLTGGYPLHLELCTDICREIKETTKREPEIQDFEGAAEAKNLTEELVHRLLRQLKDDERDLMCLSVYPRWVSEEILEVLSSVPESVPRIFKKFASLSMFSPHAEIQKAYIIRKEVRDCLIQQQCRDRLWTQRHSKLATFHQERWEETKTFHHLREAVYHSFYENSEQAMKMFDDHFWKLLDKFNFAEAEGLLEAVPVNMVSKEKKRKIDYASARLLTSSMDSHQSLITAKNLYETLITSETDEKILTQYFLALGKLLPDLGEYENALECFQKCLELCLKTCGEQHSVTAHSYLNIGNLYNYQGKYDKSLEYYQRCLSIFLKLSGEEHPDVAGSYNNIGLVYKDKGEYEKALEFHQKSLAIRLKIHGEKHPAVARSYCNIGNIYLNQSECEKALECYQKSLSILLLVYGEKHSDIAGLYNSIGIIYGEKGGYVKSLGYFQKSLDIYLEVYGEKHPHIANSNENIGTVYNKKGEYEKALEYFQKCLAIRLKVVGVEHPCVAVSYNNIGVVYRNIGAYDKALEYLQRAFAIRLKGFGEQHPDVADSHKEIAHTSWALKKEDEALEKIRRSVAIYRKFKLWKEAVKGLETLARWLEEKGRKKEAEKTRAEANKIRKDQSILLKNQ